MNNKLIASFVLVAALALLPAPAHAQTILTPTTLSAAVADGATQTFLVASATRCIVGNAIYADRELALITAVSGTTLTVRRGAAGTVGTAHANATLAFCGVPNAFAPTNSSLVRVNPDGNPSGSCTRTAQVFLPIVNVKMGVINDCLGGIWNTSDIAGGTQTAARFRIVSPDPGNVVYTAINTNGTAVGATTVYCTEVWMPTSKLLTGIGVLNGTTVTANARYVILYDSTGIALANSALAGQASVTASVYETYAFTAKFFALGPAQYFACLQDNAVGGTTVRMGVTGVNADNILTKGQTSAVFGTVPALVVPTTFTTAVGPYVYLY